MCFFIWAAAYLYYTQMKMCKLFMFCVTVLANFRGLVQFGLPLEIGDTVQILEKCEGKNRNDSFVTAFGTLFFF